MAILTPSQPTSADLHPLTPEENLLLSCSEEDLQVLLATLPEEDLPRARALIEKAFPPSFIDSFAAFVEATTGFQLEPWQRKICDRLEQLRYQRGVRLLIHGPPQFGKSILISQRLIAWLMGHRPDYRVRLACYNQEHAERFGGVNLELLHNPVFKRAFPDVVAPPFRSAKKEWSTGQRAAFLDGQPSFRALGIRAGIVGLGADLFITDDPYNGPDEAYSDVCNDGVWTWWTDAVEPRLNTETNVVVMFHRWRTNDLAGRLEAHGGWEVMRFPAIADGEPGDCSDLPVGEALSPGRYPLSWLIPLRDKQPSTFACLHQGQPGDAKGNLIKTEYFRSYWLQDGFYHLQRGDRVERVRQSDVWRFCTVDWASSDAKTADWTVCSTWGVTPKNDLLWLNMKRGREEGPEAKILVRGEFQKWEPAFSAVEKNGLGLPMTQDLEREGWPIRGVWQHKGKEVNAQALAIAYENGRVFHPREADWLPTATKELLAFPRGEFDDILDTGSLAARAIVAGNAVIRDFNPSLHVGLDPLPYDPQAPLVIGWGFAPLLTCVFGQQQGLQLQVFGAMEGRVGEGAESFAFRVAAELKEEFCGPSGSVQGLKKRCFGPDDWLNGEKGDAYDAFAAAGFDVWGVHEGDGDPDAMIRARCTSFPEGQPALLIDPGAETLTAALQTGYAFKVSEKTGLPMPKAEENASASFAQALGVLCVALGAVKIERPDPYAAALRAQGQPGSASRGGRVRGR